MEMRSASTRLYNNVLYISPPYTTYPLLYSSCWQQRHTVLEWNDFPLSTNRIFFFPIPLIDCCHVPLFLFMSYRCVRINNIIKHTYTAVKPSFIRPSISTYKVSSSFLSHSFISA